MSLCPLLMLIDFRKMQIQEVYSKKSHNLIDRARHL